VPSFLGVYPPACSSAYAKDATQRTVGRFPGYIGTSLRARETENKEEFYTPSAALHWDPDHT